MARLYISEYARQPFDSNGQRIPSGEEPAVTTQVVTYTGTAAASAAFDAKTKFVRIHTDGICSVAFGVTPVATLNDARMIAGSTEFFGVLPGLKVSAIVNT